MEVSLLLRGLIIGFSVAAVVGPIGILCIHRTLHRGFLYGLVTGLGAATADALYGSVAGFGLTVIAMFLVSMGGWIRLIGGIFLLYLGVKTVLSKPAERAAHAAANNFLSAYASTLLLTLANPQTILSFAAIFAGIGVGAGRTTASSAALVIGGVFTGSALWWLLLAGGISLLRGRFTSGWLIWVNRLSGCIIIVFGALALLGISG